MPITVAELQARLGIDSRAYEAGLKTADRQLQRFADESKKHGEAAAKNVLGAFSPEKMRNLGAGLTLGVTTPLVALGAKAIKTASSVEEAQNKISVVFGRSGAAVQQWAKTTGSSLGQSERQALSAAGTFGNLFTTIGLGQQPAADMSRRLVELASHLGSFHDVDPSEVLEKLRSGLVGEAEPMRTLGVLLNETTVKAKALEMGLGGVGRELTEGEKVQARYALILQQSGAAHGDFGKTADSLANSTRTLNALWEDTAATIGKDLVPIAKDAVKVLKDLLTAYNNLPEGVRSGLLKAGIGAAVAGPVVGAAGGLLGGAAALKVLFGGGAAAAGGAGAAAAAGGGAGALGGAGAIGAGLGLGVGALALGGGIGYWLQETFDPAAKKRRQDWETVNRINAQVASQKKYMAGLLAERAGSGTAPQAAGAAPLTDKQQEKLAKQTAEAQSAEWDARLASAKARVAMSIPEDRAAAEAVEIIPVLAAQQEALKKKTRELAPKIKEDAKAREEYHQARTEVFNLQAEILGLEEAAQKEAADKQKEIADKQKEALEKHRRVVKQRTMDWIRAQKDWWEEQFFQADQQAKAAKEQADKAKETASAQRRMVDAKADLAEARAQTFEAAGFGGNAFRMRNVVPALFAQLKSLYTPGAGDTPEDVERRKIEAEAVKRRILEASGFGPGANQGPGFNPRALAGIFNQFGAVEKAAMAGPALDPMAQRYAIEKQYGGGGGVTNVFQVATPNGDAWNRMVQDPGFQRAVGQFFNYWMEMAERRLSPGP